RSGPPRFEGGNDGFSPAGAPKSCPVIALFVASLIDDEDCRATSRLPMFCTARALSLSLDATVGDVHVAVIVTGEFDKFQYSTLSDVCP
ncbi:hypothetical protein ABTM52_19850, partial [Acinetobacter baumannii]